MAQVDTRAKTKDNGVQEIQVDLTLTAGANPSTAVTFNRAFAATPRVKGVVRVDNNAAENFIPQITALTATGFTLRVAGTTTVNHTYYVTLVGDYNNATAY